MRNITALVFCFLTTFSFSYDEEAKEEFFLSTPEQVASLSTEPSYLIGGLISPLSGHPTLRQTDLIAKGAQDIVLSRTYIPPHIPCSFSNEKHNRVQQEKYHLHQHVFHNYKGWQFHPHLKLIFTLSSMEVLLTDPSGMSLNFRLSGDCEATLTSPAYALSNAYGEAVNGKYDPRNTRISYQEDGKITVYVPDGTVRWYEKAMTQLYLLKKEILPNGKVLKYHYNEEKQPDYVESLDPKERFVYASIQISGSPWKEESCHFTSSSGLTADYSYERRETCIKIKEKNKRETLIKKYYLYSPPILSTVSTPFYRQESLDYNEHFLLRSYEGKNDIFTTSHAGFGEGVQHYRVHKLAMPVGQNDAFEPVYELSYQPPVAGEKEGITQVKNSDGTSIVYHFSKSLLTTSIQYFEEDGELKKEKVFSWDDKNWLQSIEMRDGHKNLHYRKAYQYDLFGNSTLEIFTGDLTGEGNQETLTTKRIFSEDGRNLLLREESEDGKVLYFSYLPNTNLMISKLIKEGNNIILREFFIYDDSNNLIQKISDDGTSEDRNNLSNITQRNLTTYTLRQSSPFLHMPQWSVETYWEDGTEKPLKKNHFIYDQHGNIAEEEVYDAEGQLAFTICKTYNEAGDVLSETNRLRQKATYTYDARGLPTTTTNFSHRLHVALHHDTRGRLRKRVEEGDDGIIHETSSEYDFHDRLIRKTDPHQNITHYTHDPLVNEITKTDLPPIASEDGQSTPVVYTSTYDPFGRKKAQIDANGNTTTYRYNTYGSVAEITHPDGSKEYFKYTKKGTLAKHTDPDGLTIHYTHDILGRVLTKKYTSANREHLAEEIFTYSSFNLLTETDKEGNIIHYSYDGAGRKIQENICGQITDFSYDSLGQLSTLCKHNKNNTLQVHYKRDIEGRILEEHKTNIFGETLYEIAYSYDEDGNQKTITRNINGKEAIDTFFYDSFHRPIQYQDAEGYARKTTYNENFTNQLQQKVLQKTTIDQQSIATIETRDALDRTIQTEKLNPHGATISCQEMIHDPSGNLTHQKDHLYENDQHQSTQTIKYTHTQGNRIASITRASGAQDERTTTYTYLPSGKIATKTLPDGISLTYSYHPLGQMSHLDSSDGKIHHAFICNRLGHLTSALDENQNIAIKREVDPFGNVTQEVFPTGLEVNKQYDDFNRLTSLKMAGQGEVLYTYDPLHLKEVTRTSPTGEVLYHHTYEKYDLNGNLISEKLIGTIGQVTHTNNLKGEKTSITSPYFTQECKYDEVGNLITSIVDNTPNNYTYDELSQLNTKQSFDSLYNRTQKNYQVNDLNELLSFENTHCSYDLNGNQTHKQTPTETFQFTYDPLNRLTQATSKEQKIIFTYDPLGRRLSKTTIASQHTEHENYLYHGQNEIGAFTDSSPKNLRVLGLTKDYPTTISIEIEGHPFIPLLDVQNNIRRLIDLKTNSQAASYDFTPFGEQLSQTNLPNPWRYASKRLDPELNLIYFGKRYYDPQPGRWLTPDPAGFLDSANPYQFVWNNPFRYYDPDGQFAFAIPLLMWGGEVILPVLSAYAVPIISGVITGAITYAGCKVIQILNENDITTGNQRYTLHGLISLPVPENSGSFDSMYNSSREYMEKRKKSGVDANLSDDPFNDPNLEDISHPNAKEKGHHTFKDKKTGEIIEFDKGKPGAPGHKGHDHYHKPNPDAIGKHDWYLDSKGNSVPDRSEPSHLYPPGWIWWE